MRKFKFINILFLIFFISCENDKNTKFNKAIEPYIKSIYKNENKEYEFNIYKIDTIRERDKLILINLESINKLDQKLIKLDSLSDISIQLLAIYNLTKKEEYKKDYQKSLITFNDFNKTYESLLNDVKNLNKKILIADTINFLAYNLKVETKYTTITNIEKKDSLTIILNDKLKILEKTDFLNIR